MLKIAEIYCLFFRTSWGVGVLNSAIFNSFHNRGEFGTILEGLRNFGWGGGGLNGFESSPRYATAARYIINRVYCRPYRGNRV